MPRELLDALSRKQMRVDRAADVYEAMRTLVAEQDDAAASGPFVVLVANPDQVHGLDRLVRAAAQYTPRVVFWQFDPSQNPKLRGLEMKEPVRVARTWSGREATSARRSASPMQEPSLAGKVPQIVIRKRKAPSGQPELRLTGGEPLDPCHSVLQAEDSPATEENARGNALLTEEELAMLWSDEPGGRNDSGTTR